MCSDQRGASRGTAPSLHEQQCYLAVQHNGGSERRPYKAMRQLAAGWPHRQISNEIRKYRMNLIATGPIRVTLLLRGSCAWRNCLDAKAVLECRQWLKIKCVRINSKYHDPVSSMLLRRDTWAWLASGWRDQAGAVLNNEGNCKNSDNVKK